MQAPKGPDPFWRGSRLIYALSPDLVLIITHNEHADDPSRVKAKRPRRNARSNDDVLISYLDIVNRRKLSEEEVAKINFVIKTRATRYVASAIEAQLFPENKVGHPRWSDIDKLFYTEFASSRAETETIVRYKDDSILFSNAFGERELIPRWFVKQREKKSSKTGK
jgi:hypothetical protein